jgi:3D (Asp-Asp-Asp) domain-containing protein
MNEQDKSRNRAAINRLKSKISDRRAKLKKKRALAALILCIAALAVWAYPQETHIDAYGEENAKVEEFIDEGASTALNGDTSLTSLGEFKITHYCPCVKCCGKTDGITYTGTIATAGRTIGVDPEVIPLGSTVYIDGQAYIAEDTGGGIKGKHIDMFTDSHEEALRLGVQCAEVLI